MRTSLIVSSLASALTLTTTPAFADDAETNAEAPIFNSLDRTAQGSHVGADLSFAFIDGVNADDSAAMFSRLDLHGAYVHESGFGGYGNLAVSKAFLDDQGGDDVFASMINDETALSNLELGGVYQRRLSRDLDLSAHVGIALPTASDELGFLVNGMSANARLSDSVLAVPNTTWLRFGVTPTYHKNNFFVRADVGMDIGLDNESEMGDAIATIDPIAHANLGVGYVANRFAATAELATTLTTGDVEEEEDRFMHTAAVSAEYRAGRVTPSLTVATILDERSRGDVIVSAGVKAGF